jgi:capsular exopolysaccharide synthesis family protein
MSYIFEALQRAEAERSGESLPKNAASVVDLLEATEGKSERPPSVVTPADRSLPKIADLVADVLQAEERESARQRSIAAPSERNLPENVTSVADLLHAEQREGERQPSASELPPAAPPESEPAESFASARVFSSTLAVDSRLVCLTDQGGLAAEKFRVLGLKLRHLRERRKLKRIVVTGTAPEEGKSLVAANLAINQARSKILKTLLVDGDLRRPTLATRFGFDRSLPGLSECLRGQRQLPEVVYKLNGSGLWFLPAGRAPENPLELMQSGRLSELLDRLGNFFDWIVIDTPPVVPVADTTFWMKLADGVLLVIREGVSEKKVVERALDSFDRAALLGVVVNSCSRSDHKDYYSRYSQAKVQNGEALPSAGNEY